MNETPSRRTFCTTGFGVMAAAAMTPALAEERPQTTSGTGVRTENAAAEPVADRPPPENLAARGEVPRRRFGSKDVEVSAIGLGGHAFASAKTKEESIRIVHEAIDEGITFMDNAWDYHDGRSESLMGEALQGRRDKVFLMTKVCSHGRDRKVAMQQLEESLRRLRTDHLDLWQIHEVVYENDPELHFQPGGAIEALDEARRQGKVRFVGFTGHKSPEIHLDMLGRGYRFDSVQLPLSGFDASFRSFEARVLPVLLREGIAPIGMKSLNGNAAAVKKGVIQPEEAIRYAMSLPVTTTVSGIDSLEILRKNLRIAKEFTPMTPEEKRAFREKCRPHAQDGRFEMYKVSIAYDGPEGRRQHGFPGPGETDA